MSIETRHIVGCYVKLIKMLGTLAEEGESVAGLVRSTVRNGFVALGRAGLDVSRAGEEISQALLQELAFLEPQKPMSKQVLESALMHATYFSFTERGLPH